MADSLRTVSLSIVWAAGVHFAVAFTACLFLGLCDQLNGLYRQIPYCTLCYGPLILAGLTLASGFAGWLPGTTPLIRRTPHRRAGHRPVRPRPIPGGSSVGHQIPNFRATAQATAIDDD